jgi:CubicO group peptidase (beta-lactamase class C family)
LPNQLSCARACARWFFVICGGALLSHLAAPPVRADDADAVRIDGALACRSPESCVDQAAQAYLRDGQASALQIAIWRDGRFVYSEAFGFADPDRKQRTTVRSLFQVGSNTKKATAVAVLRAVEEGRMRLDDPVSRALPFFRLEREPGWARAATVRDLLSHQSGLWDYTPAYSAPADDELQCTLWGTFASREWAPTPPRAVWSYANANYALLGAMLEHAYRQPYADVMQRAVYAPLHMSNTYARSEAAVATGRAVWGFGSVSEQTDADDAFDLAALLARPAWALASEWVPPEELGDSAFLRPAGGAWSTAEDECRLGAFLVEGRRAFLSEASRRALVTPQTLTTPGDPNMSYAFGLMVGRSLDFGPDEWYDVPTWTHTGSTLTMASMFLVLPEQRFVISVLRNARDPSPAFRALMSTALAQFARLPPRHAEPARPPDDPARYAGTYSDPRGLGTVRLRWDGASLSVSAPDIEALGVSVAPTVTIVRPNILVLSIEGRRFAFTVWPSSDSSAGYLVGREDTFTRIGN